MSIESELFVACRQGKVMEVDLLLYLGANVDSIDDYGKTPLHIACLGGHTELVILLLNKGADPHIADPLYAACDIHKSGYLIAKLLLTRHPSLIHSPPGTWTPLHRACYNGNAKMVRYLIQKGANIHARDGVNETPLFDACTSGSTRVVRLLLNAGAIANDKHTAGRTPLDIACSGGYGEVARLLVKAGGTLETKSIENICEEEFIDVIWMLLETGAKPIDHPVVRKALAIIKKRHIEKHATLSDHLTCMIIR